MKKIIPWIIVVVAVIAIAFFFRDNIGDKYNDWQSERLTKKEQATYLKYAEDIVSSSKTLSLKKYENEYLSFEYPEDWTVEDRTEKSSEVLKRFLRLSLRVSSPKIATETDIPISPYMINIRVVDASVEIADTLLTDEEKSRFVEAVAHDDLRSAAKIYWGRGPQRLDNLDHEEFTTLNDRNVYVQATGSENIFYGGTMYFISRGNIISVKAIDVTTLPIPQITSAKNDLLSVFDERVYGRILRSVVIK